jgi:hypothetical protein
MSIINPTLSSDHVDFYAGNSKILTATNCTDTVTQIISSVLNNSDFTGATGPAGADGATGPAGSVGPAGATGPTGSVAPFLTTQNTWTAKQTFNTNMNLKGLNVGTGNVSGIVIGPSVNASDAGIDNIGIGTNPLSNNTTGSYNIGIGTSALLYNTTGQFNVALGYSCLPANTTGTYNTGVGALSLSSNTTGNYNTGVGINSLASNTTGYSNTAVGNAALASNTSGNFIVSVGTTSLSNNTTGTENTAIGVSALALNISGNYNSAFGRNALRQTLTSNNSALGYRAGFDNTNYSNITCLGNNAQATGSNQVILGDNTADTYVKGGSVQTISDLRDKADIIDTQLGLSFIERLRPVDYKWDYRMDYVETIEEGESDISSNIVVIHREKDGSKKHNRYHHGLLAQEVKQVMDEMNVDFGGYQDHKINGGADQLTIGYTEFVGPLIKAVQELAKQNEELFVQNQELATRVLALENK